MKNNLFTLLTKFLVIILPFYVIIKVFFEIKVWFGAFGFFIKEFIIILLFFILAYYYIKDKKLPKFEMLDYLIFSYFIYWILISLFNNIWLNALVAWARYDFIFLIVFLIFRHGKQYLQIKLDDLVKLFLISASISLIIWLIIKFIIWEEILEIFWFSIYVADWQFKWWIPIYHWVEASGIRRFQGLLDWPNQMWFFMILFSGLFLHINRKKIEFHIILTLIISLILILLTYSRSALLGIWVASFILIALNLKFLFKKYKKESLIILGILIIFSWFFYLLFQDRIHNIFIRSGSTEWHFNRMQIWINRFIEHPMGQWLSSAWPAFRASYTWEVTKEDEAYYIPESWFIQQLIEWWFIYFTLFISIITIILLKSFKKSKAIFASLIAILIMNIFLHIFEATYLSILLFIFLGLLINKKYS